MSAGSTGTRTQAGPLAAPTMAGVDEMEVIPLSVPNFQRSVNIET